MDKPHNALLLPCPPVVRILQSQADNKGGGIADPNSLDAKAAVAGEPVGHRNLYTPDGYNAEHSWPQHRSAGPHGGGNNLGMSEYQIAPQSDHEEAVGYLECIRAGYKPGQNVL